MCLWTYILIIMLLGCAFWFTFKTNFVQFRMIREMVRLLGDSTGKTEGREHHISSFQAFAVSIASRVGTGNLAGVATAITLGGPGAVFWMWVSAILGMCTKFSEVTLAVHFRERNQEGDYVGGPMYYIKNGLSKNWHFLAVLFSAFGVFNSIRNGKCYSSKYDHNSDQFCFIEFPCDQSVFCWNCESDHWYHCCDSCGIDLTWRNQENRTGC